MTHFWDPNSVVNVNVDQVFKKHIKCFLCQIRLYSFAVEINITHWKFAVLLESVKHNFCVILGRSLSSHFMKISLMKDKIVILSLNHDAIGGSRQGRLLFIRICYASPYIKREKIVRANFSF